MKKIKIQPPYVVEFGTHEDFKKFFPFIEKNSSNSGAWQKSRICTNTFYDEEEICVLVEKSDKTDSQKPVICSHASKSYFLNHEKWSQLNFYSFKEWQEKEEGKTTIDNFEIW